MRNLPEEELKMDTGNKENLNEKKIVLPTAEKKVRDQAPMVYRSPCCCTRNRVHSLFLLDAGDEKILRVFYAHSAVFNIGSR